MSVNTRNRTFAHAQADLNICEAHMFEGIFSHVAGQTDFEGQKDWFGIHIPEGYGKNALYITWTMPLRKNRIAISNAVQIETDIELFPKWEKNT